MRGAAVRLELCGVRGAVWGSRSGPGVVRGRLRRAGSRLPGLCRPACRGLCRPAHPRPVPVCAPRPVRACRSRPVPSVRAAACAGLCGCTSPACGPAGRCPACGPVCVTACACLPVPACLYVPACRRLTCWGLCLLCAGVCAPGWWAGCAPYPGAGVAARVGAGLGVGLRWLVAAFVSACGPVCGGRAGLVGRVCRGFREGLCAGCGWGLAGFVDAFVVVEAGESVGACGLCGGVVVAAVGGEGVFVEGEVGGVVEGCAAGDGFAVCLGA